VQIAVVLKREGGGDRRLEKLCDYNCTRNQRIGVIFGLGWRSV
jgi:hypothetical protein